MCSYKNFLLMMKIIILTVLLASVFSDEIDTNIRMVQVIFRHGMRYPKHEELYPNDPHYHLFSDNLYAQLTDNGKKGSFGLGQLLRKRYWQLINQTYDENVVKTTSTSIDRTIMTAQLVLAGLFQNSLEEMLNKTFEWDKLPYKINKDDLDIDIDEEILCTAYRNEFYHFSHSDEYRDIITNFTGLFEYISNHSGAKIESFKNVNYVYQTLNIEENLNLTLPKWTREVYPDKIHQSAATHFATANSNVLLKRLNGGKLLRTIIDNMETYLNTTNYNNPRMFLLSGHDRSVASILSVLDKFKPHIPKFNSAVIFELHQGKGSNQHFIKIFYVKGVSLEMEQLFVQRCSEMCKYEDFVKAIESVTPVNYEDECNRII